MMAVASTSICALEQAEEEGHGTDAHKPISSVCVKTSMYDSTVPPPVIGRTSQVSEQIVFSAFQELTLAQFTTRPGNGSVEPPKIY